MDRSDWKGNIKLKGLGQTRLAGLDGKCDVQSDGWRVIADPRDASASKKIAQVILLVVKRREACYYTINI